MKTRTPRGTSDSPPHVGEGLGERSVTRVGFAPIVRVDTARREIELCATSEAVDAHGTVFAYAASRDAFARWAGNVREMHERKAVGRRVAVRCDDDARKVYVRVRISMGAEDTWQKVLDGTLRGASIGAANVVWRREGTRAGARDGSGADVPAIPIATRYDLVELSLVDLPSNPDALGVTFVRDGVPVAEVLDDVEEESEEAAPQEPGEDAAAAIAAAALARGRAQVAARSGDAPGEAPDVRRTPLHERAGVAASDQEAKRARLAALGAPGYVDHERARGPFSTNPDGAPDMGVPARAEERPTMVGESGGRPATGDASSDGIPPSPRREGDGVGVGEPDSAREAAFHGAARSLLQACGCPACQMALAALAGDASDDADDGDDGDADETRAGAPRLDRLAAARLTRTLDARMNAHLEAHTQRLSASIGAVHEGVGQLGALLGRIERRVAVIEEQPMPGGPQLRVADKTHALLPGGGGQPGASEQLRALEALAGRLNDPQAQIAVATEMIRLQQQAAGLAPDLQAMPRAGSGGY